MSLATFIDRLAPVYLLTLGFVAAFGSAALGA
jgi:hypothetical protein